MTDDKKDQQSDGSRSPQGPSGPKKDGIPNGRIVVESDKPKDRAPKKPSRERE